jgi:hypothetical protein
MQIARWLLRMLRAYWRDVRRPFTPEEERDRQYYGM